MRSPLRVDVAIVGGGIIGLSAAHELGRRGLRVVVLERDAPGAGATRVAAGMLAPVAEAEPTQPDLLEVALASAALYPDFVADLEAASGIDCGYDTNGTLLVALDRDDAEALGHSAREHTRLGLGCEALTGRELRVLEPRLSPRVVSGFRLADDVQVDPRALTEALVTAVERQGGSILAGAAVRDATPGSQWRLDVAQDGGSRQVVAESVIVAAGSWSTAAFPGLPPLPLRPVKGQVVRLHGEPQLSHVVRSPDVYLIPRRSGELVIGASSEEQGFDDRPLAGPVLDLLTEAARRLPAVRELELREVSVGFRPALRDHLPAIGPHGPAGLYVATGHYRNGILLAPATARMLADLITGDDPEVPEALSPGRFAHAAENGSECAPT